MATEVIMPKVGLTMIEGMVTRWLKAEGQPVAAGEPLMVIMTEKVEIEVLTEGSGILHQVVGEGASTPATATVGWLLAPGEQAPVGDTGSLRVEAGRVPATVAVRDGLAEPAAKASGVGSSPAARRFAAEFGVELSVVRGTGPGGKIIEADVRRAAEEKKAVPHAQEVAVPTTTPTVREIIPLRGVRKMIAERMLKSLQGAAQFTGSTQVDATELVRLREALLKEWQSEDIRVTYTDIAIKAAAKALRKYPLVNSHLIGDEIRVMEQVNIGVAVAVENGLVVPVVKDADRRTLKEIAQLSRDLSERARAGRLALDDMSGGTFTVSSMGMYEIDVFTPIINIPEVAILGVGAIRKKPAIQSGQITERHIMTLNITADHRAIDGAPASEFVRFVARLLENPYLLFL